MPDVIRPRLTFLLPLAAVLVAGCTGLSDNDAVARVEQVELSSDDLTALMSALSPANVESDPTNADAARDTISLWVRIEAAKLRLAEDGVEVGADQLDEATTQMSGVVPGFATLPDRTRDYLVEAQASFLAFESVAPPSDTEIRDFYERGPVQSDITCVAHILVETEGEADEAIAELAGGADFATVAAARSIDPGSGAQGGALPCEPTGGFATTYVPPFVEAALQAEIGVPTEAVESQFGFHIIVVRPYDDVRQELAAFITPQEFAITRTIEQADVYIDPRYGTLEGSSVVPLT